MNYKKIIVIIFLSSFIFSTEIWEKNIPPSSYLKSFAIKSEKDNSKALRYASYFSIFCGEILFNRVSKNISPETEGLGDLFILGGVIGLLVEKVRKNKPRTAAGKEYKEIKNIQDKSNREMLAYEVLVKLAEDSRIKKNKILDEKSKVNDKEEPYNSKRQLILSKVLGLLLKPQIEESKEKRLERERALLTKEEKLLTKYLNQVPIR